MDLDDKPFRAVESGRKTIEMRLNDERRAPIKSGDVIVFKNTLTGKSLRCLVVKIYRYGSFAELYLHHDKLSLGYGENETANHKDMLKYYAQEKIDRYGVLGIEIKVI